MHALVPLASKEEIGMSAFVIVESTVRDREPLGRYTAQAEPITRCVMAAGTRPTTRRVPGYNCEDPVDRGGVWIVANALWQAGVRR
jgi:hypothetical protein